jgi:hypothetical protein
MNLLRPRPEPPSLLDLLGLGNWPRLRPRAPVFAVAALAAIALAAGLMNHVARYDYIPPERQGVAAPPALQQALDKTPVGASTRLADGVSIEPRLTFSSRLKLWCREFGTIYGDNALLQSRLACRGSDGIWRVRNETDPVIYKPDAQGPRLAGEAAQGVIARARDELKDGDVLGVDAEAELIRNGWQGRP